MLSTRWESAPLEKLCEAINDPATRECAVTELRRRFHRRLLELARSLARNQKFDPTEAEDVVDDLFKRIMENGLHAARSVEAYLDRAVCNSFRSLCRRRRSHQRALVALQARPQPQRPLEDPAERCRQSLADASDEERALARALANGTSVAQACRDFGWSPADGQRILDSLRLKFRDDSELEKRLSALRERARHLKLSAHWMDSVGKLPDGTTSRVLSGRGFPEKHRAALDRLDKQLRRLEPERHDKTR